MDDFNYFIAVKNTDALIEIDKYLYSLGYKKYDLLSDINTLDKDYTLLIDEIGFKSINLFELTKEYMKNMGM